MRDRTPREALPGVLTHGSRNEHSAVSTHCRIGLRSVGRRWRTSAARIALRADLGRSGSDVHGSASGRDGRPHPLDQRRTELRRRLGRPHRGDPAQHRGDRARCPPWSPEDRRPLAVDRLRVWPGRGRRRLHRVVLQGRSGGARAVRAGGRRFDPQREDQERGLLVRVRQQPRHRPADDDERVAGSPGAEGAGRAGRRHLRHLRRHTRHGRQPDRRHGRAGLPGLELEVEGRSAHRLRSRLPGPPGQHVRDHPVPALPGDGPGAR